MAKPDGDVWLGMTCLCIVLLTLSGMSGCSNLINKSVASEKCQALGYSAGHYEKEAGLVCEQWIEAAKVREAHHEQ